MEFGNSALGDGCSLGTLEACSLEYSLHMNGSTKYITHDLGLLTLASLPFHFCFDAVTCVKSIRKVQINLL